MKKLLFILCAAFIASCAAFAGCSMANGGKNSTTGKTPATVTQNNTDGGEQNGEDGENGENGEMPDLSDIPELPEIPERGNHAMRPEPRPFKGRCDKCGLENGLERADFFRLEISGRIPSDFKRPFGGESEEGQSESGDTFAKDVNFNRGKRKKRPDEGKEKIMPREEVTPDNNADDGE